MMLRCSLLICLLTLWACSTSQKTTHYEGHGASSVSAKDLARYAPKPLSRELTAKIEAMMDVRAPSMGILSSNGQNLIFNWNVSGTSHIWRWSGGEPFPVQLTGGQEGAFAITYAPDEKSFFFSRDQSGNEYYGIYQMDIKGGVAQTIYQKDNVSAGFQDISPDGRFLYFYANDINPAWYSLYRHDLKTKQNQLLIGEPGFWRLAARREDGLLLVAKLKTNMHAEFYLLDENKIDEQASNIGHLLEPLLGQHEMEEYQLDFTQNPGQYLVRTNKFGEYRRLYLYDAKTNHYRPLSPDSKADVTFFRTDRNFKRVLFGMNEGGYTRTYALDMTSDYQALELPEFAHADAVTFGSTSFNSRYSMVAVETHNAPSAHFIYDWQEKKLRQVTRASTPEINTTHFVRDSLEYYPSSDGVMIPMFVKRPASCENKVCPVIVNFHGGPESQARPGFNPVTQLYLDEGFIYVRPNVRGSNGYGKTWLAADDGPKRLDVITDIADAGRFIKKEWAKDGIAPKVGVMGGSYGGYATFLAMTKYAGVYDAGVASVGMSSLVTFLENTAPYRRALRESEYGSLENDREALIKLSPITYFDRLKDPLMIIHGATDPRVPAGEGIQMQKLMEEKAIDGELVLFADEGHGVRKRENRVLNIGHTLLFFKKHLQ